MCATLYFLQQVAAVARSIASETTKEARNVSSFIVLSCTLQTPPRLVLSALPHPMIPRLQRRSQWEPRRTPDSALSVRLLTQYCAGLTMQMLSLRASESGLSRMLRAFQHSLLR
jgi:hypothetical protein